MKYTYEFSEHFESWVVLRDGKLVAFAENEATAKAEADWREAHPEVDD